MTEETKDTVTKETATKETTAKVTKEKKETVKEKKTGKSDKDLDNIVFIGNKPFMNYVTGVVMQFTTKGSDVVIVKARGKFISRAVDVVEVARKKFLKEMAVKVEKIDIDSEKFENKEGREVNVSTIEITLKKSGKS